MCLISHHCPHHLSLINLCSALSKRRQDVSSPVSSHICPPFQFPCTLNANSLSGRAARANGKKTPASLRWAQRIAPLMHFVTECHWLVPGPRTVPSIGSVRLFSSWLLKGKRKKHSDIRRVQHIPWKPKVHHLTINTALRGLIIMCDSKCVKEGAASS